MSERPRMCPDCRYDKFYVWHDGRTGDVSLECASCGARFGSEPEEERPEPKAIF